MADNLGLLNGLKICENRRYEPLQIIGDSSMIIRQQKNRKPPKSKHRRDYYWEVVARGQTKRGELASPPEGLQKDG
ncbi:hypothetical protein GQ600_19759 [Phytophthora cactorum]|nr:hypothetical protein GQ600_19759 [Phytophthora cactorum]